MREVEWETLKWVDWYDNRRLLGPIGYIPPAEAEEAFYANLNSLDMAAWPLNKSPSGKAGAVQSRIYWWQGAFAVAGAEDHGRVGSHRYLTCVPVDGLATADFIWFYLQTHEGLGKVQAASPGSADRNRTLGQGALEAITVPAPSIERQRWFNRLQTKAREARTVRASTAKDMEALIPAMLHEIFNSGPKSA